MITKAKTKAKKLEIEKVKPTRESASELADEQFQMTCLRHDIKDAL